jgi:mono/diheme cytochrome c family protein
MCSHTLKQMGPSMKFASARSYLAALIAVFGLDPSHASARLAAAEVTLRTSVDDFRLTDQELHSHQLSLLSNARAVVLITQQNNCPVNRNIASSVKALQQQYANQGVEFMMLNSTPSDSRADIVAEAKNYGYDLPILLDSNQLVGEQLGVTRAAEAIVIDPKGWKIIYRGPIDDRVSYQPARSRPDRTWVKDALQAMLTDKPVAVSRQPPVGCPISFPERATTHATHVSYVKSIAPLIRDKCVACHQPGGIGPMPLTSYDSIKPWAPMIREVIRTQRMPPWRADPTVGHFMDDRSLSPDQIKLLVHWVEAGAPRGAGVDPLAALSFHLEEWPLGPPDLVLDLPSYDIPATGIIEYQRPFVVNPLTEGKWLRASTIEIENRQAVHHVLTGYMSAPPPPGEPANESTWGASVGAYAVGAESTVEPADAGVYLPPGGAIGFQIHYTTFGKAVTEHSKIALYFYKETPKLVMHRSVVFNPNISIPANVESSRQLAYLTFPKDALLYSAFPHAHFRGSSSQLILETPDGRRSPLLALPHYDFNWQRDYYFAEPISIPAGSKLIAVFTYDNSVRNPANPDHDRVVPWGDQSFDEMLFMGLGFRWVGETSDKMREYSAYSRALMNGANRLFGMLDSNVNGKLEPSQFIGFGAPYRPYFAEIDTDHDGFVEPQELTSAFPRIEQRLIEQAQAASAATADKAASN